MEGTRVTTGCQSGVKFPRFPLGTREKCKRSTCKWLDSIWESGVISTGSEQVGTGLGSRTEGRHTREPALLRPKEV